MPNYRKALQEISNTLNDRYRPDDLLLAEIEETTHKALESRPALPGPGDPTFRIGDLTTRDSPPMVSDETPKVYIDIEGQDVALDFEDVINLVSFLNTWLEKYEDA